MSFVSTYWYSIDLSAVLGTARVVRRVFPDGVIVVGGMHPTIHPREVFEGEIWDQYMGNDEQLICMRMLKDAKTVLDIHNVTFWLDCGTLLGAVRNECLIPWDNDIDLGCWKCRNDYYVKQTLKVDFQKLGYDVFMTDHWLNIHTKDHSRANLDINFYSIIDHLAVTAGSPLYQTLDNTVAKFANRLIQALYNKRVYCNRFHALLKLCYYVTNSLFSVLPLRLKASFLDFLIHIRTATSRHKAEVTQRSHFQDLVAMNVFDGCYMIPRSSKGYLSERYGKDWEVPDDQWNTLAQDGTVRILSGLRTVKAGADKKSL